MKLPDSGKKFQKKIIVDVGEEISALIRKIELNYGISSDEAINSVNISIKNLNSVKIPMEIIK
jgi:hypothetical protein